MFFVFNKQKIYAYLVSIFTVILLFFVASMINQSENAVQTAAPANKLLPIYNVETEETKEAFTMN